ncbi:MAG TPA: S8 family serine peptidase [Myxococcaceae bacterium]|nr:S8 family serine peptidase [Myxococcaceae bacterium]
MIRSLPSPGPRPAASTPTSAGDGRPGAPEGSEAPERPLPLDAFVPRPGGDGGNACLPWTPPAPPPPPVTGPAVPPSGPPVVVVMDGAMDEKHQALAGAWWTNAGEIAGDGIDNDGNGVVDDVHGFNVGLGGGDLSAGASLEHGTHVAGIVAAKDDGRGHAGVAAGQALVMGVGGMYDGCDLLTNFERAVDYVVDMKGRGANVRVVNASFGGAYPDPAAQARWKAAVEKLAAADILFCAATDNGSGNNLNGRPDLPGNLGLPNQVTVAAMDRANDKLAPFSSYGDKVIQIAAVGDSVVSTAPGGGRQRMSGTSMATPEVAGAAALAFKINPSLSAAQVRDLILQTARKDPDLAGKVSTGGKLDVNALLEAARRTVRPPVRESGWGWDWFEQLAA